MKSILNFILSSLEAVVLVRDYPLKSQLTNRDRLALVVKLFLERLQIWRSQEHEIRSLICMPADERVLVPVLLGLLQEIQRTQANIRVSAVYPKASNPVFVEQLRAAGCNIEHQLVGILKPCIHPHNKLVLFCLDHRLFHKFHARGVTASETLQKFGVKTASIQHGGTRKDSVEGLASTASEKILIWGERVQRELISHYQVSPERIRLVGNHLHDRIHALDRSKILSKLDELHPQFSAHLDAKKVILLATCLHTEYADRANEQEMYKTYMHHLYDNLDFSQVCLIIKMHPADQTNPNIYRDCIPHALESTNAICIVESHQTALDVYSLLYISDLLITRASTVAEEALLLNKKVVAFDIDAAGPSKAYRHLEDYGRYRTAYVSSESSLRHVVQDSLFQRPTETESLDYNLERELAYALDGNSMQRTVAELLHQLAA
jgi:hypothetical protein